MFGVSWALVFAIGCAASPRETHVVLPDFHESAEMNVCQITREISSNRLSRSPSMAKYSRMETQFPFQRQLMCQSSEKFAVQTHQKTILLFLLMWPQLRRNRGELSIPQVGDDSDVFRALLIAGNSPQGIGGVYKFPYRRMAL